MNIHDLMNHGFQVVVFKARYGSGYYACLEYDSNQLKYVDCFTSSDPWYYMTVDTAISRMEWFPLGFGSFVYEALQSMTGILDRTPPEAEQALVYGLAHVQNRIYQYEQMIEREVGLDRARQFLNAELAPFAGGVPDLMKLYSGGQV